MLVYLLPICSAIAASWLLGFGGDLSSIAGAFVGLVLGGLAVRGHSEKTRYDSRVNPVLFDALQAKQVIDTP